MITRDNRPARYETGARPMSDAPFIAAIKAKTGWLPGNHDLLAALREWIPGAQSAADIPPSWRQSFVNLLPDGPAPAVDTTAMPPPVRTEFYGWHSEHTPTPSAAVSPPGSAPPSPRGNVPEQLATAPKVPAGSTGGPTLRP